MNRFILFAFVMISAGQTTGQISPSDNKKFLTEKNRPFFWLGDTDWEMAHRLTREEATTFIKLRAAQGFNVLQVVALAEFEGIRQPNRYGDWPLNNEDPTQLLITPGNDPGNSYQYDYWDHLDFIIQTAAASGIYIGLLPTWGDKVAHLWGDGPLIFDEQNAERYAQLLAERYANQWNIVWILGGDRPAVYKSNKNKDGVERNYDDRPVWRAMARGIENVCGKNAFITYHPAGGDFSTSQFIHNEPWLDMNAFQSGHGARETEPWKWVVRDLSLLPQKPTLDMEPCYEDHPVNPWDGKWTRQRGYFTAYDVRARIYRSVFAGACGVTYGHHQVWQFMNQSLYEPVNPGDTIIGWQQASHSEGAGEMKYLKDLMLSRPYFSRNEEPGLIKSDRGSTYVDRIVATRDEAGVYAMVYLPQNKSVKINLDLISGSSKKAWWYDPRTGNTSFILSVKARGVQNFQPPVNGQDWVLVIDDASREFPEPGKQYVK